MFRAIKCWGAEICIGYRGAISYSSVAWTAASIVLCIEQMEKCFNDLKQYDDKKH